MYPSRTFIHGAALLSSLLVLLLPLITLRGKQTRENPLATIAVEHTLPLTLSLTVKKAPDSSRIEIGDASNLTYVSVPTTWKRREVWGVPVASITTEGEGFGFTRWHLPPKGTMAFFARPFPPSLLLHNPSPSHLTLKLTLLDLDKNHTALRTILIEKESEKILW